MEFLVTANNTEIMFENKNLQKASMAILKLGESIRKNWFQIAYIVSVVDKTECYKDDGFKSVTEWCDKTFGLKKTATYSLLTIGRDYTREITNASGKVIGYGTNLVEDGEEDFSKTQVEKMLPLGHDIAEALVSDGVITPEMTAKEIADVVKDRLHPVEEGSDESDETEEGSGESEEIVVKLIRVTDEEGNIYDIPEEILAQYRV